MIDASHNLKDPLEDLIQATDQIQVTLAQALLVDRDALADAQDANDPALAAEVLHAAYRTDVRPLVAEARRRNGAALAPLDTFRRLGYRAAVTHDARRRRRRQRSVSAPVSVTVVAVDFGATVDPGLPRRRSATAHRSVDVVHRYAHAPVRDGDGTLRWDWDAPGRRARARARRSRSPLGPLASIGIDTWGVDYGLLDHARRARGAADLLPRRPHRRLPAVRRAHRRPPASTSSPACSSCRSTRSSSSRRTTAEQLARAHAPPHAPRAGRRTT